MGASGPRLFRTVTMPLMMPGYFAGAIIVFIWAFTDLGTPLIFNYSRVVPVVIFDAVGDIHENPMGFAMVVLVLVLTVFFFLLSKKLLGAGSSHQMMSRGHVIGAQKPMNGRFVPLAWLGLIVLVAFALLPHISVLLSSIADRWFMSVLPTAYTGKYYDAVFTHNLTMSSIRNSFFLSSLSTVLDIVIGVGIAYLLARKVFPGKDLLDALAMLPLALPGLVLAFGYVGSFSGTFLDVKVNPMPLLVIAYAIRRLPYMIRAAYAGFKQTSEALEEESDNLGASPARRLRKIGCTRVREYCRGRGARVRLRHARGVG